MLKAAVVYLKLLDVRSNLVFAEHFSKLARELKSPTTQRIRNEEVNQAATMHVPVVRQTNRCTVIVYIEIPI